MHARVQHVVRERYVCRTLAVKQYNRHHQCSSGQIPKNKIIVVITGHSHPQHTTHAPHHREIGRVDLVKAYLAELLQADDEADELIRPEIRKIRKSKITASWLLYQGCIIEK
jgi:hypothetical protein